MPKITAYSLHAVELPFRGKFQHAASSRETSSSLFVQLTLEDGTEGWGEALPRSYVTGETVESACALLSSSILPKLLGLEFSSFAAVTDFLTACDGEAPPDWVQTGTPQTAAWCSVDLALLDAYGKHFGCQPFGQRSQPLSEHFRYSGVLTSHRSWKQTAQLFLYRFLGYPALKLKVDADTEASEVARLRRRAGPKMKLRADVNMGWDLAQALAKMPALAAEGIHSFEQPMAADDLEGASRLVRETGLDVMADESLNNRASLERLISSRSCTAINARISKCGGLIATLARCRQAAEAGLWVQIGCQVGESSLLSAAHLHLCSAFREVRFAEGCFGKLLLAQDPASPLMQMRRGGVPPEMPTSSGIGVTLDLAILSKYRTGHWQSPRSAS